MLNLSALSEQSARTSALMAVILISGTVHAGEHTEFDRAFQNGIQSAGSAKDRAINDFKNFNPTNAFRNYTSSPHATKYWQDSDTHLKNDAFSEANNSSAVSDIKQAGALQGGIDSGSLKREVGSISQAQTNGTDSSGNISDEFKSCTKIQSCTKTWTEQSCESAPEMLRRQCLQRLTVRMIPEEVHDTYDLSMHLYARDHTYAGVTWNTVTGDVIFLGPHEAKFTHTGNLPASTLMGPIQGEILKADPGNPYSHLDHIDWPSTGHPAMSLHVSGSRGSADLTLQVRLTTTRIVLKPVDEWVDGCTGFTTFPACTLESTQCIAANETRDINGVPVTRDCWEKTSWYTCSTPLGDNACRPLADQGCEQISMNCVGREKDQDSACTLWHRVYRCPVRTCRDTGVSCAGETYCLEGDCLSHDKIPDGDFQRAVSALSGTLDSGTNFDGIYVFGGKSQSCDDLLLGAANCCRDSGWLVDDLALYHCSSSEKELGRAREQGETHYVGREDSILKKTRTFCVFPSLLARIIQEQGRNQQLGKGFGNAEHPDCKGMTPDELQKIDFSRIDFRDFYAELEKKKTLMTREEMEQKLRQKMQELIDKGKSNDKKIPS